MSAEVAVTVSVQVQQVKGGGGRPHHRGAKPGEVRAKALGSESPELNAAKCRQHYSDRLDELFRNPELFLRDILELVAAAEDLADAADGGDRDEFVAARERVRGVRARLREAGINPGVFGLLDCLQWGLFPELHRAEYDDEFGIRERYEVERAAKAAREEELIALHRANRLTASESAELNATREAKPRPATCRECGRPHPRVQKGGLVPVNGGERLGARRLAGLVAAIERAG